MYLMRNHDVWIYVRCANSDPRIAFDRLYDLIDEAFEAVSLAFQRDDLLLGQLDIIAGALLAVLSLDVGGAYDLGRLLLGLTDDIFTQTLGIDHRGAQRILLGTVLVDTLGQNDEVFLHLVIFSRQGIHAFRYLLEVVIHIIAAIAAHRFVKCYAADILRRDHGFPPVCGQSPLLPDFRVLHFIRRVRDSLSQYW